MTDTTSMKKEQNVMTEDWWTECGLCATPARAQGTSGVPRCPTCGYRWMEGVEPDLECPSCNHTYTLAEREPGASPAGTCPACHYEPMVGVHQSVESA